ncbi:MAG: hypothetical protein PVI90_11920 [Desulfobacteraceae bacterium]|jgi:hypothetical protein
MIRLTGLRFGAFGVRADNRKGNKMYVLQIVDNRNAKNVIREKCMASVKRFVTEKDTYTVKEIAYNPNVADLVHESDIIRFTYAKEYDDLLYVDTDCFLSALPTKEQMSTKKVIAGETNGKADIFLFYVNGNKSFFREKFEDFTRKPEAGTFSVPLGALTSLQSNSVPYDNLSYCHFSLTSLELSINKQLNVLTNQIKSQEKEINAYRSGIQNLNVIAQTFDELRIKGNDNGRIRR